ncbi:MAG TPA: class I SAM-dependent methyltransferase [Lacunisphaera sp.]
MTSRDNCPACGRTDRRLLTDLSYGAPPLTDYLGAFYRAYPQCDFHPLESARYRLFDCARCGCIYQDPVPDGAYLARFYGHGLYGAHAVADRAPIDPYQMQQIIRELMMVVRFLQSRVPHPQVLDFGAGEGGWAQLAAASGLDTHATDLSDHAFDRLTARGVTCHRPDLLPSDSFDFINTEQVFEHLPDPSRQLAALRRSLRTGGVIKIGVPYDPRLRVKLRQPDWLAPKNSPASLNGVAPIEHLNHFEPASLQAMAAQCGLEPLTVLGWNLATPAQLPVARALRPRFVRWLRGRLGDAYKPHHPLTQTVFFHAAIPAQA